MHGPNPHPKRMLLSCPAFLHVGPKKHAGVRESQLVRAPAAVAVAQWMARALTSALGHFLALRCTNTWAKTGVDTYQHLGQNRC